MFTPINGWTKERMIQAIQEGNKGTVSTTLEGDNCAYRGVNGNKCAVGCFIPDDEYDYKIEGLNIDDVYGFKDFNCILPLSRGGMIRLQHVHDNFFDQPNTDPRPAMISWIKENVEASS